MSKQIPLWHKLNSSSTTTSFMDILNHNVVFQTQKRIYGAGDVMSVGEYETKYDSGKSIEWLRTHTASGVNLGDYDSLGIIEFLHKGLNLLSVFAYNVEVVTPCFAGPALVCVNRSELAERVCGE